jgi:hypothetical protein
MEGGNGNRESHEGWSQCVINALLITGNRFDALFISQVEDFNPITPLISHVLLDIMHATTSEHPVLVTEPAWNTPANRERMAEIMFEDFQVPAFYVANTSVLNA